MDYDDFGAIATLVGCIIGAGIFGIPYAVAEAGFLTSLRTLFLKKEFLEYNKVSLQFFLPFRIFVV
ncbi:MAG: aromatic amino acid transport family protein, partial [Nanobdellota archaeon]